MNKRSLSKPNLAEMRAERTRLGNLLHHAERDHLEYGIPRDRHTPVPQDPAYRSIAALEEECRVLDENITKLLTAGAGVRSIIRRGLTQLRRPALHPRS